ncbi:hypothetical protein [Neobacillus sp. Marseille-QA0830]
MNVSAIAEKETISFTTSTIHEKTPAYHRLQTESSLGLKTYMVKERTAKAEEKGERLHITALTPVAL